jgi:alpha-methylacyl-CoA racemase
MNDYPFAGVRVVTLAPNLPGPAAAQRMVRLGASVVKVEPPAGDPVAQYAPDYYRELAAGQDVRTIDIRSEDGHRDLASLLAEADLLITSSRPRSLVKLGLAWEDLHVTHPRLCQIAIVGYPGDQVDRAGHDLTYQAEAGTLTPPQLPSIPMADLAGAERVVGDAAALLFCAARTGEGSYREVSLSQVVEDFSASVSHGLSGPGTVLGGEFPGYGLYRASDGWLALAALEPHFLTRLGELLGVDPMDRGDLERVFAGHPVEDWVQWAEDHDVPLTEVKKAGVQ